jgi:diguanylate cyclase (GGDEF)-like protein
VLFQDRLNQAIAGAQRNARLIAVLFIDLDRFKVINDTLGHGAGDALLRQVAERLSSHLRAGDTVGRLGGDEFAVILGDLGQAEDAGLVAQKLLDAFGPPFYLEGREVFITPSIGITVFPYDGIDSDVLVRNADAAMYRAKDLGRNTYHFYTAALNARAFENLRLETDLRRALERGEFVLHYQPKASLATGEVTGLEALLRWRRPDNGLVAPGEFIPLLEETGLIVGVGAWVLRAVCAQLKQWREAELAPIPVALNLSARQFHHRDLAKTVEDTLREYTVDPALIEFELTESSLMANPGEAAAIMRGFKALGIRLAVDDFGTGYSSLSHLKRFPLDSVKIDRSFVRDIIADSDDASIIRAVITMAHSLKLKVVAEGVETDSQLAFLAANRCDEMQGYFFSKPLPAEEVTDLLRSGRRLDVALPAGRPPRRTLLAVDDEANILSALKRLLRREGYDILTASSAREGLELLARHQVGVIVSDQRMPEMTGVEFLSRVKELHPGTVRIVLSGYTDLTTVQEAINEGAIYKFLTKPWDDDQLRAQIAEAFRSHELAMENERLNDELTAANTELQRLLRDKSEQAERGELYLGIAQETLQTIPFPVIGVDDGGMIAMANREAEVLCGNGGALLGGFAHEALPQGLLACLADDAAPATARVEVNGRRFDVLRQTMGGQSCSQGKVLVMVPCQGVNGAPH